MPGTLYLVATPIGNLGDMTPRAVQVLTDADLIAAEDTRRTLQLLNHFSIKGKLIHYDENNKEKQGPVLLQELLQGKNIALVTDAGFPGISDPGEAMAKLAIENGISVVPVPGANACLTALVASGLPSTPFFFGAFLPKSKKNRREQLIAWKNIPATIVLYEAPHRIMDVLEEILAAWGDRQMAFGRELTKLHEEFWRGTVSQAILYLKENPPRGEFVLVIAQGEEPQADKEDEKDPLEAVKEKIAAGVPKKEALSQIAKQFKIPKRDLYNRLIQEQEKE
ncbi:MAG: 16S rRNA (cytidine(1402)-2'-O)-methyltransferase [Acidaminococcaceae bacterium]|uniref:16S rRNA (cytidine(1402)-2'-O)-methyltransferase n=1 Tax=Succiniclasticum sp. TaxID=2775030 RepID=UPI001B435F3C|nr:16S rRNA (cytidine(1402)-2'-O)-methyltransferase [Succiniclasticum sp.]MBP3812629.1 16S rRNA (cytidine(1402)-2'-O)-methyltransferase [Acidaminococcaceae bacterium]MBR1661438.1 16S rRNA (cytidine(1402)-2'-O)-methyltransferase [Acidaminococcaceae bacterium]MDY6290678.1 16S rRNA (cytidine(1402)-2'-O)-methyltransferase [Succiniclasticum sp.]